MADRYWVGGNGTWDGSAGTKWATTSGGAGGAAVPTLDDNVFFDANSLNRTILLSVGFCANLDLTGFPGSLGGGGAGTLDLYGSLTLAAGKWTDGVQVNGKATSGSHTITTAGNVLSNLRIEGVGGTWTLQDDMDSSGSILLSGGTLNTNDKNITNCGLLLIQGSLTKTLTLGASTISVASFDSSTATNYTLNAGTSILTGLGAFATAGETFYEVVLSLAGDNTSITFTGAATFAKLRASNAANYTRLTLSSNITVTDTLQITGNNASTERVLVNSNTVGTPRTITFNGSTLSLTNVDFRDITKAGSGANFSGTSIGDAGGNTNITTTSPVTRYWVHPVGASANFTDSNWSTSTGGSTGASVPLPQDTALFDANSFAATGKTVTLNLAYRQPNINWTGVTNSPTWDLSTSPEFYGSVACNSGVTLSGAGTVTLLGRGASTITSGGVSWGRTFTQNSFAGSYTFGDAFTGTLYTITTGTFNDGGYTTTLSTSFSSSNSNVRSITATGTLILTGSGNIFQLTTTTNLTISAASWNIKLTNNSASTKTFAGGGKTYGQLWNATAGAGAVNITGSNTFSDIKIDGGRTQRFTAATTTTFTTLTRGGGLATDVITLGSITAANHSLVKTGGGIIDLDYLSISRSQASPANTFYAGAHSTDGGNNSGWIFQKPPERGSGMLRPLLADMSLNLIRKG